MTQSSFFQILNQLATFNHVEFRSIRNYKQVTYQNYSKTKICMFVLGQYADLIKFLNKLILVEDNLQILDLSLTPLKNSIQEERRGRLLELNLEFAIYESY